jgi:hypothetical protein
LATEKILKFYAPKKFVGGSQIIKKGKIGK